MPDEFLRKLQITGTVAGIWQNYKKEALKKLYSRFICGPHFRPWYNRQCSRCKEKLQDIQRKGIVNVDDDVEEKFETYFGYLR